MRIEEERDFLNPGLESPPVEGLKNRRDYLWLFPKNGEEVLSTNFILREFRCRCNTSRCHMTLLHPKLVESLQTLRDVLARPLILTSAYRCASYNKLIGGRLRSYHTKGMAADLLCSEPEHISQVAAAAAEIPALGGIGIYPIRRFVHLDVRPRKEDGSPEVWSA